MCLFPDVFKLAICMSGTYDLRRFYPAARSTEDFYESSPLHVVPAMDGDALDRLRQRFVVLASGEGANEDIGESWTVATVLGVAGDPQPRRLVGPGLGARLAAVAGDAARLPGGSRVMTTRTGRGSLGERRSEGSAASPAGERSEP